MKRSTVRFSQLHQLLEGVGFQALKYERGWVFEHAPSGGKLLFRKYRPTEFVYPHDLVKVQSHLNWRGLMSPDAFDQMLTKTPA